MARSRRWRKKRLTFGKRDKLYGGPEQQKRRKHDQTVPDQVTKIGAVDSSFIDSVSTIYYLWINTHPLFLKSNVAPKGKSRRIATLQNLCARILAQNSNELSFESLKYVSKTCLKLVWNQILVSHNDSLGTFMTFASLLQQTSLWRCHPPSLFTDDNLMNLRNDYLQTCLLPFKTHRLENLFKNIRISDLQTYLNTSRLDFNVFLDFSFTPDLLKNLDYIMVFKIKNLAGLDLSNDSDIDDYTLSFLNTAIRDGKLPRFRILRLVNCPKITKSCIESFMKLATTESTLSIITCDNHFPLTFQQKLSNKTKNAFSTPILGTQWSIESNEGHHGKNLLRMPVAFQHYYLCEHFSAQIPAITEESKEIYLDILVHNEVFDFDTPYYMLNQIKNNRISQKSKSDYSTCLIVDKTKEAKPVLQLEKEKLPKFSNGVFTKVTLEKKKTTKKRLKPKAKPLSASDFF